MRPKLTSADAVRRAVVVGKVEVRDAEVERAADGRALGVEQAVVAEVLPEAEREQRQLEAAATAAAVGHRVVARVSGLIGHAHHPAGDNSAFQTSPTPWTPRAIWPELRVLVVDALQMPGAAQVARKGKHFPSETPWTGYP